MERTISLNGWQLFFGLNLCRQKNGHGLKIPTLDELKQMKKESSRRFKQQFKNLTRYNRNLRGYDTKRDNTTKA